MQGHIVQDEFTWRQGAEKGYEDGNEEPVVCKPALVWPEWGHDDFLQIYQGANSREKSCQLKGSIGTRTDGCKMTMNKFGSRFRR